MRVCMCVCVRVCVLDTLHNMMICCTHTHQEVFNSGIKVFAADHAVAEHGGKASGGTCSPTMCCMSKCHFAS